MMELLIVSDVGGTQIRVAAYDANTLLCVNHGKILTKAPDQTPIQRLINLIWDVSGQGTIKAISIGLPGLIDIERGMVLKAPNIIGWSDYPARDLLMEEFSVPIWINNDANLAALGEWKYGIGQGHRNLLYLTISTGIGSGVIVENQLLLGATGLAAEFGHVIVEPNGDMCGCGQRGHLEAYSSGTAIASYVTHHLEMGRPSILRSHKPVQGLDIYLAAQEGDELAREAYARAGKYLGLAISNFLHILNPSIVILGGGVTQVGKYLLDPMHAALQQAIIHPEYVSRLLITNASLADNVGLQGALAFLLMKLAC